MNLIYDGFEAAFIKGKITRTDLAIDLPLKLSAVIPDFPKLRKRVLHYRPAGTPQSLHLGATNASRVVLYEKKETGLLRVERRFNPGINGVALLDITNPFEGLVLLSNSWIKKSWIGGPLQPFSDSILARGLERAMKPYPAAVQKRLIKGISHEPHVLFDASEIWHDWPNILKSQLSGLIKEPLSNFTSAEDFAPFLQLWLPPKAAE